jgi:AsmA family protein
MRVLKWTGLALGALVLAAALALLWLDQADLHKPASRMLSARIGQPVRMATLDLDVFTLTPRAVATGLELNNPRWAGREPMARAERVTIHLRLPSLLRGEVVLPRVEIRRPDVRLLRTEGGLANWPLRNRGKRRPGQAPDLPLIQHFAIEEGRLRVVDRVRKLTFDGTIEAREHVSNGTTRPLHVASVGKLNGKPFRFELTGAPLANIERTKPYRFSYDVAAGDTRMKARGSLDRPFNFGSYQADITLSGEDAADLYFLTGLALPNTPPYRVAGHVERTGSRVYLQSFTGKVGDSDLDVEAEVVLDRERPLVKADVTSQSLDLDDLGVPFGASPSIRTGETASPEQRAQARAMAAKRKLFPNAKLQVNRLRAMDADVQFQAAKVTARRVPLREVSFRLRIDGGVLTLDPVSFVLPQGRITGLAQLDARQDLPAAVVDARIVGLQLGQFKSRTAREAPLEGTLLGRIYLKGYGASIRELVSTGDGDLTLVLPKGEVREAFAELTGINVTRGLGLLLRADEEQTGVRCGVADFALKRGTLHAKTLVFDTDDVLISGRGSIDLGAEAYDLSIKGEPKKFRIMRVRSPIAIRGPLRKPDIGLESGESLTQTGIAAALASLVAPLAAVLAFVDPGLADDANCSGLLAEAKRAGAPVKTAQVEKARRG